MRNSNYHSSGRGEPLAPAVLPRKETETVPKSQASKSSMRSYEWIFNFFVQLVSNKSDCDRSHRIAHTALWIYWYNRNSVALKCLLLFITLSCLECPYYFKTIKTVILTTGSCKLKKRQSARVNQHQLNIL